MRLALAVAFAMLAASCAGRSPLLIAGDAKSAVVKFSGDLGAAAAVAGRHCARWERVAKLTGRDLDTALFACVRP